MLYESDNRSKLNKKICLIDGLQSTRLLLLYVVEAQHDRCVDRRVNCPEWWKSVAKGERVGCRGDVRLILSISFVSAIACQETAKLTAAKTETATRCHVQTDLMRISYILPDDETCLPITVHRFKTPQTYTLAYVPIKKLTSSFAKCDIIYTNFRNFWQGMCIDVLVSPPNTVTILYKKA